MIKRFIAAIVLVSVISCEESLDLLPFDRLSEENVIVDDATADQALQGLYSSLNIMGNYGIRKVLVPGVLSDELVNLNNNIFYQEFDLNELSSENIFIGDLWTSSYQSILRANIILELLPEVDEVNPDFKSQVLAHANFIRGLMLFELVRYFGEVPIVLGSDLDAIQSADRASVDEVYGQIIGDLTQAAVGLPDQSNTKALANSAAAEALLARVYIYRAGPNDLNEVIGLTSGIIENNEFELESDYAAVFAGESKEVIFEVNGLNSRLALESRPGSQFNYAGSSELVNSFESEDQRESFLAINDGNDRFYSDKYLSSASNPVILRLADMVLLRAEALTRRGQAGDLDLALLDLNRIRSRAGIANILTPQTEEALLQLIERERFIELAYEGHRFFDLVRTGRADDVLRNRNPDTWQSTDVLMPIPFTEVNFGMRQNEGYQ